MRHLTKVMLFVACTLTTVTFFVACFTFSTKPDLEPPATKEELARYPLETSEVGMWKCDGEERLAGEVFFTRAKAEAFRNWAIQKDREERPDLYTWTRIDPPLNSSTGYVTNIVIHGIGWTSIYKTNAWELPSVLPIQTELIR